MVGGTDRPDNQERRDQVAFGTKTSLPNLPQKPSYHADVSEPERDQTNNTDLFINSYINIPRGGGRIKVVRSYVDMYCSTRG